MKRIKRIAMSLLAALAVTAPTMTASAQSGLTDFLGNMLEGVFSKSNLTVYDVCGQWTSTGSAVSFQSENLLQKAGGMAAAGLIENKINPYFEKLGLNNAVMTIEADSTFTLKAKKFTLNGTISSNGDGTFMFNFKAMKMIPLGSIKAYVQKSGNNMDVMFDATKLKTLISGIAKISKVKIASTAASLLDSYEGLCLGFKMNKTGDVKMPESVNQSGSKTGLGGLLDGVLGGSKKNSTTTTTEEQTTPPAETNPSTESTRSTETSPTEETNPAEKYTKIGTGILNKVLNQ